MIGWGDRTDWGTLAGRLAATLAAAGGMLAALPAAAQELIPTPEFAEHGIPVSMPPHPAGMGWEWLHVGLLVAALGLASYFALVTRSRRGLLLLSLACLLWFGFYRKGCICSIGATQNVALALGDGSYAIPLTVVLFFALPLVFTLFFGRTFCAAVCPLGAAQELVALRHVRVPTWLDHALGLVPYLYLGAAVIFAVTGTAFIICRYDPFVAMFRLSGDVNMLVFGASLLVLGVFVGRPYCRYLCPYGAILGLLSKAAKWHARIPPERCIQCRLCEDACPYGAIQEPAAALTTHERPAARRRMVISLALIPLLALVGLGVGRLLAVPLSRLEPQVRLAERVRQEESGQVEGLTDASEAFRNTGRPTESLYAAAKAVQSRYVPLGMALGVWAGLVFGVKGFTLNIHRRRTDYEPDRARCVSCARCYWYCPGEQVRLGLIHEIADVVDVKALEQP